MRRWGSGLSLKLGCKGKVPREFSLGGANPWGAKERSLASDNVTDALAFTLFLHGEKSFLN